MATPTIPNGETQFFPIIYEGNGGGQKIGKFVPFDDASGGTIANSCIFNDADNAYVSKTFGTPTNNKKWTLSAWVKLGVLGTNRALISSNINGAEYFDLFFTTGNVLKAQNRISSSNDLLSSTSRTFEDTSKFYHVVVVYDSDNSTSADRYIVYVDGDRQTVDDEAGSGVASAFNKSGVQHQVGISNTFGSTGVAGLGIPFDGYMAEVNFVDGLALTPASFGVVDSSTMRWIPKTLSGITYGNNGFRLTFSDSSNFGTDTSGNSNTFTATNLASTDLTTDSPTQNFATFDSNDQGNNNGATAGTVVLAEGNTRVLAGSTPSNWDIYRTSKPVASGKYYVEVTLTSLDTVSYFGCISKNQSIKSTTNLFYDFLYGWSYATDNGKIENNNSGQLTYGSARSQGDVIGIAVDMDNGKLWFSENGTYPNSGNPATGANPAFSNLKIANQDGGLCFTEQRGYSGHNDWNFGQKSYTHSAPSGFSTVQQDNMPETDKGVTGLNWIKDRDNASYFHTLQDSSRGANKEIYSNSNSTEASTNDSVTKFLKGGVAVEDAVNVNNSGDSFVAWNWTANSGTTASSTNSTVQVNSTSKFSIVQYNGTGSDQTIGHGLGVKPDTIWVKCITENSATGSGVSWRIWQKDVISLSGDANSYLRFDSNDAHTAVGDSWGDTAPTSSVFTVGADVHTNASVSGGTAQYIAYCFANVDGYSKTGKYVGNSNNDGSFIWLGFKPSFVLIKSTSSQYWMIQDSARWKFNPTDKPLFPSFTDAESGLGAQNIDLLANGFKCRSSSATQNSSSHTYIYVSFAEHPFVGDGTNPTTAR